MRITGRILRSQVDMVYGKPLTVIFSFALPLLVGNLFNQLYNVVDTAIVGRALGADALAAVGSTVWGESEDLKVPWPTSVQSSLLPVGETYRR